MTDSPEKPIPPKVPDHFEGTTTRFTRLTRIKLPDGRETSVQAISNDNINWVFHNGKEWVPIDIVEEEKTAE